MKKPSSLLSRKSLRELLRARGIKRIAKDAYDAYEHVIRKEAEMLARQLKERLLIKGRTTLRAADITSISKEKTTKEETWEV